MKPAQQEQPVIELDPTDDNQDVHDVKEDEKREREVQSVVKA